MLFCNWFLYVCFLVGCVLRNCPGRRGLFLHVLGWLIVRLFWLLVCFLFVSLLVRRPVVMLLLLACVSACCDCQLPWRLVPLKLPLVSNRTTTAYLRSAPSCSIKSQVCKVERVRVVFQCVPRPSAANRFCPFLCDRELLLLGQRPLAANGGGAGADRLASHINQ